MSLSLSLTLSLNIFIFVFNSIFTSYPTPYTLHTEPKDAVASIHRGIYVLLTPLTLPPYTPAGATEAMC